MFRKGLLRDVLDLACGLDRRAEVLACEHGPISTFSHQVGNSYCQRLGGALS
ncbi:hypothetical protein X805_04720 [Sphaerotilus natans subsp. natans DSM 6575]|uniref:Uncharacterized protein n=1 Tax=Sphaerotilus natans subsp. natans DSM 6575 TaxID=1286631 RepID=A0A059KS33_9BURK|nr:hypothetical protein X805_04720 [Sphaerotilus natans subsp. natans DSM 6575]